MTNITVMPACVSVTGQNGKIGPQSANGAYNYSGPQLKPAQLCEIGKFLASEGMTNASVVMEVGRGSFGPSAALTVLGYKDGNAVLIMTRGALPSTESAAIDVAINAMKEGNGRQVARETKIQASFTGDEVPAIIKPALLFTIQKLGYVGQVSVLSEVGRGYLGPTVKVKIDGQGRSGAPLSSELKGVSPADVNSAFRAAIKPQE